MNYTVIPGLYKKFDVDFNLVKLFVCEEFGITLEQLHSKSRKTEYSNPRMMCIYIGFYIYNLSYKNLQFEFNLNSNQTIQNAKTNIGNWVETDSKILGIYLKVLTKMEKHGNIKREQGIPHIWDAHQYGEWIE